MNGAGLARPDARATRLPHVPERRPGVLARVPLASGYPSGKYTPDATFDDARDDHPQAVGAPLVALADRRDPAATGDRTPRKPWRARSLAGIMPATCALVTYPDGRRP